MAKPSNMTHLMADSQKAPAKSKNILIVVEYAVKPDIAIEHNLQL